MRSSSIDLHQQGFFEHTSKELDSSKVSPKIRLNFREFPRTCMYLEGLRLWKILEDSPRGSQRRVYVGKDWSPSCTKDVQGRLGITILHIRKLVIVRGYFRYLIFIIRIFGFIVRYAPLKVVDPCSGP